MILPWTKTPLQICNGTFICIINTWTIHEGGCIENHFLNGVAEQKR